MCVNSLQEVSDVAMAQVSALQARQKSKDIEVECLRRQILDYQVNISCWNFGGWEPLAE